MFAIFHPRPTPPGAPLNRDYLSDNSSNFRGLATLEAMIVALKPPAWPWPVDKTLAAEGKAVFERATDQGGCADCHGIKPGENRGPRPTWKTPVLNVGTDTRMWGILRRTAATGSFTGAYIPRLSEPLGATDSVANILKTAVIGALAQAKAKQAGQTPSAKPSAAQQAAIGDAVRMPAAAAKALPSKEKTSAPTAGINQYESRVLQGIWAAPPVPAQRLGSDARRPARAGSQARPALRDRPGLRHRRGRPGGGTAAGNVHPDDDRLRRSRFRRQQLRTRVRDRAAGAREEGAARVSQDALST